MLFLGKVFDDGDMELMQDPCSPDSTPLDLSPNMEDMLSEGQVRMMHTPKEDPDPDPDPERSADRRAVALAMVMDLTKPTGTPPPPQSHEEEDESLEMVDDRQHPPRKKQRKRPGEDEKICRVCGDKALAHNFDAITCESCKAFFRRNALRAERNVCLFKGECPVTVQTRRFCPACRLQKCFNIGMKADLILDDGERKARMEKVSENRAKRKPKDSDAMDDSQVGSSNQMFQAVGLAAEMFRDSGPARSLPTPPMTYSRPPPAVREEEVHQPLILPHKQEQQPLSSPDQGKSGMTTLHYVLTSGPPPAASAATSQSLLNVPPTSQQHRITLSDLGQHQPFQSLQPQPQPSQHQPPHHQTPSPQPLQRGGRLPPPQRPQLTPASSTTTSGRSSGHLQQSEVEFQHVPRDILPSDPHMYWRLSEEEKTLLTQLSSAYQDTIMTLPERVPCDRGGLQPGEHPAKIESIFETSEKNTQQLISFVQRLGDFHLLREDDKIAVLQASAMRSVILRWTALYVVERNAWLTRFGECDVPTAANIFGHEDIINEMAGFCRSTKKVLKNDVTLFVLTHCLILFDPREPNIVDRQLIGTFRDKYIILLKHYLESEYSFLYTERYLRCILDKTVDIREVAEKSMGIMREFKAYAPPLMKQIFNLNENS